MPKLIDYPRTSYTGAWELAEVTDDTGGKCAIETAARKLDRKASGSFKAIIGSAVKFGLLTSKRELLSTTTLFKRIKHAYDKQEELLFHREAFLTPPLFAQICRKFRSRELPVQMLDVMLIREFGVEEINAAGVAKAFVDGCRMVGILDEHNIMADIDALSARQPPRREIASQIPLIATFQPAATPAQLSTLPPAESLPEERPSNSAAGQPTPDKTKPLPVPAPENKENSTPTQRLPDATASVQSATHDAIASLFGLASAPGANPPTLPVPHLSTEGETSIITPQPEAQPEQKTVFPTYTNEYRLQVSGPGINTNLSITEEADIALAIALLEKIRRQLQA